MAKKIEKIEEEELKALQTLVGKLNNLKLELGNIETTKHKILHQAAELETKEFGEMHKTLEEKYGKVNINISDGSINEIVEDGPSKKD